ncbi:MAG: pilus assembly protein N-terminal domain-containing protein [Alphaproteobacteria bacterium]|nr:pilus assembly protein N-terminal domain-containing protein [Alphaproteobacteria bacterium]
MIGTAAHAQDAMPPSSETLQNVDILPAKSVEGAPEFISTEEATHSALKLTPDKSELVRLDADAASVIIGNPAHVSVLAENSRLLVFIPRAPGATYVTVLGNDGNVVMQRHVIVATPKEKYVRIRSTCAASENENCQTTQVYYCPDMCHAIAGSPEESEQATSAQIKQSGNALPGADSEGGDDTQE